METYVQRECGRSEGWVLHVDLDEFLAAVEIGRRPELRGRPVVVGGSGDPTQPRVVVATASYEARRFGIRSGMPLRAAARRCPEAVFLPSDRPAYEAAAARVMATLRSFPVVVETAGWDEAFLGVRTDDPEQVAVELHRAVTAETGLSCSIGIGRNKLQAKLATGFAKPAGTFRLTGDNWAAVMADRPVDALWGIGPKTTRRLAAAGIETVRDLAGADATELIERFGPTTGPYLQRLASGHGDATVDPTPRVPRSRSRETTFPRDLSDRGEVLERLDALATELADRASEDGRRIRRVAVKVRFAPYLTRIKVTTLAEVTDDGDAITQAAREVLRRFEPLRPIRLLGVRVDFAL